MGAQLSSMPEAQILSYFSNSKIYINLISTLNQVSGFILRNGFATGGYLY